MNPKRLCSIGILDININLFLYESQVLDLNIKLDSLNDISDISKLFHIINSKNNKDDKTPLNHEDILKNYHISLDSDSGLINTLLYINKAYKHKTFIEFIIPDKLEFNSEYKYLKNLVEEMLYKNYLFIIESDKKNNFSKINFVIKVIDEIDDKILNSKSIPILGSNNDSYNYINILTEYENDNFAKKFLNQFNYNFHKINYLIINLKDIRKILIKEGNIYNIFFYIIKNYTKLKIILIIDDNIINAEVPDKYNIIETMNYLQLSDIIFSFKNNLNTFLRQYFSLHKRDITTKNTNKIYFLLKQHNISNNINLISKDFNKTRTNIPRISIIFDELNSVHIYEQDILNKNMFFDKAYPTYLLKEELLTEDKAKFLMCNADKIFHIFIAGFLSRLIYDKYYDICFEAGNLLMKKNINFLFIKHNYGMKEDKYNINIKKTNLSFYLDMMKKEKNFVLDCMNKEKSKQKEYSILEDNNCLGYLTKKYCCQKYKPPSLIDKVNTLLKERKAKNKNKSYSPNNTINNNKNKNNKIKFNKLLPFLTNDDMFKYKKGKEEIKYFNEKNLKTIYYINYSKHIKNDIIKKNLKSKSIMKNCLDNINRAENYNKILFKIYNPNRNKNIGDYIKQNNS